MSQCACGNNCKIKLLKFTYLLVPSFLLTSYTHVWINLKLLLQD